MGWMKKQRIGFFVNLIVAVMILVTLVIYVANTTRPYYEDMNTKVAAMTGCALVLIMVAMIIPQFTKATIAKFIADASRIGAAALIIVSGVIFIGMRVESFGYIFGSNLELGNEEALHAGTQAITEIVLYVVTWILSLIASFFELWKKEA